MKEKIRGVNLGGWLVLEKWMTPELFAGTDAVDETTFSRQLTPERSLRLRAHRDTFIQKEDFAWIAGIGLNTVRIPVPHWLFGDIPPYSGCLSWFQKALAWAQEYDLEVMADLHCAPGCQNGFDNGGIQGVMEWHKDPQNMQKTLDFLDRLCEYVKDYPCVTSIQLLNEPHWEIDVDLVKAFYEKGYQLVRRHFSPDRCAVVLHDNFKCEAWKGFLQPVQDKNVIMDAHFYQFQNQYDDFDLFRHADLTMHARREWYQKLTREFDAIVGEWSLGYPLRFINSLCGLEKEVALRLFAAAQLAVYEESRGWIFWSYKVLAPGMEPWSLRRCVEKGWLPPCFQ